MCIWGVVDGFSLSVPSLASVSVISFPLKHESARTLCMCIVCGKYYILVLVIERRIGPAIGWRRNVPENLRLLGS